MIIFTQMIGALYGMLAVVFGAFGAHALKKIFSEEQLKSFETGVKYQMYHAIVLLVLGYNFDFSSGIERYIVCCFSIGTLLFSFSIYGLCISAAKNKKIKMLGPITPLGGLFLVIGWGLLLFSFLD
ncbi:DUF423 domain-containing protein [Cellulophaga sp. Asnod2-G02]|uniref:DUF423 domain-containing protein n=1 Tax=Cellulophaga sp. Asnod2-G02 TaxID=3160572 RepID=UPI003863A0F0